MKTWAVLRIDLVYLLLFEYLSRNLFLLGFGKYNFPVYMHETPELNERHMKFISNDW